MANLVGLSENCWIRCVHWICVIEQVENGFPRQCLTINLLNLHFVIYFEGRWGGDTSSPIDMEICPSCTPDQERMSSYEQNHQGDDFLILSDMMV